MSGSNNFNSSSRLDVHCIETRSTSCGLRHRRTVRAKRPTANAPFWRRRDVKKHVRVGQKMMPEAPVWFCFASSYFFVIDMPLYLPHACGFRSETRR